MSKHSQKSEPKYMVCSECVRDCCELCVNVSLILLGRNEICECKKQGHNGEPRDQQVLDPETGAVHAPGLTITEEGEVQR